MAVYGALLLAAGAITVLLALTIQDLGPLDIRALPWLLQVNQILLLVLVCAAAYASWRFLVTPVRLVKGLLFLLISQLVVALAIAGLPLLVSLTALEDSYRAQLDAAFDSSERLSASALRDQTLRLSIIAAGAPESLRAAEGEVGALLDALRVENSLSLVAVLDASGRALQLSPPDAQPPTLSPIMMQILGGGGGSRELIEEEDGRLRLVWIEPLPELAGQDLGPAAPGGLWLETALAEELSDDMRAIEEGAAAYRITRATRPGREKGLNLVVLNIVILLALLSLTLANHFGSLIGDRLTRLREQMDKLGGLDEPTGGVPEDHNDEITDVTRAYNEMVDKVRLARERERRQTATLQAVQDTLDAGLLILGLNRSIVTYNSAAAELLRGEMRAEEFELLHGEDTSLEGLAERLPDTADLVDWLREAQAPASGEVSLGRRSIQVSTSPFTTPDSKSNREVVLLTDISEPLTQGESRVREEAFSFTLHGINNPLQAALLQAELLERGAAKVEAEELRERLLGAAGRIAYQLQRINEQAKAWGALSGREEASFRGIDLNGAVSDFAANVERGGIGISTALDPGLEPAFFDPNMLQDLLENLFANSREQFAAVGSPEPQITIVTSMEQGRAVLRFSDNAGGIDDEVLPHIFKPHKSFKSEGHGIGLARVHDWLQKAGATVKAANIDEPPGACFTVTFSAAGPEEAAQR